MPSTSHARRRCAGTFPNSKSAAISSSSSFLPRRKFYAFVISWLPIISFESISISKYCWVKYYVARNSEEQNERKMRKKKENKEKERKRKEEKNEWKREKKIKEKKNKMLLISLSLIKVSSFFKIKDWSILNFSNHVQSDNEDLICASGSFIFHLHMSTYLNVCFIPLLLQHLFSMAFLTSLSNPNRSVS